MAGPPPPDPRPRHSPVLDLDVRPCGVHQLLPIPFGLEVHHLGLEAGAGGRAEGWEGLGLSTRALGGKGLGLPFPEQETPGRSVLGFPPPQHFPSLGSY